MLGFFFFGNTRFLRGEIGSKAKSEGDHQEDIKMASVKRRPWVLILCEVTWAPGNFLCHFLKLYKDLETNMSRLKDTTIVMFRGCSVHLLTWQCIDLVSADMEDYNLVSKSSKFMPGSWIFHVHGNY